MAPHLLRSASAAFVLLLLNVSPSFAANPTWSSIASLPEPVADQAAAPAPCPGALSTTCLYEMGGMNESSNGLSSVSVYNPGDKYWTAEPSMTTGRNQLSSATAPCWNQSGSTCVYALGGTDSSGVFLSSVEMFDPSTSAWSEAPGLPTPGAPANYLGRSQLAAAVAPCSEATTQTCLYAVGGYNMALYSLFSVEMFNPATGTWTSVASLTTARSRLALSPGPCRGKPAHTCLYAIGGTGDSGFLSSVEMFNPWKNIWLSEARLHAPGSSAPLGIAGMSAGSAPCRTDTTRSCVYAFGGQDDNFNIVKSLMMFDPTKDSWTYRASLKTSRDNFAGSDGPCPGNPASTCLFALGGAGSGYLQAAEFFDPA